MCVRIVIGLVETKPKVYPSAFDLETAPIPIVAPPPVLFSTFIFTPIISPANLAIIRVAVSPPPPAEYGHINVIGLSG